MKRMIACEKCAYRAAPCYPGEWFVRLWGKAKKEMLCDYCIPSMEIKPGDKCAAESMGLVGHGIPYYQWEFEYVEEIKNLKKEK